MEKRRKEKSMRSRGAHGSLGGPNNETPSNITGMNLHGRNNSNPYGYSFATNINIGSAREEERVVSSNRELKHFQPHFMLG